MTCQETKSCSEISHSFRNIILGRPKSGRNLPKRSRKKLHRGSSASDDEIVCRWKSKRSLDMILSKSCSTARSHGWAFLAFLPPFRDLIAAGKHRFLSNYYVFVLRPCCFPPRASFPSELGCTLYSCRPQAQAQSSAISLPLSSTEASPAPFQVHPVIPPHLWPPWLNRSCSQEIRIGSSNREKTLHQWIRVFSLSHTIGFGTGVTFRMSKWSNSCK
jgi:hypothetical protein